METVCHALISLWLTLRPAGVTLQRGLMEMNLKIPRCMVGVATKTLNT